MSRFVEGTYSKSVAFLTFSVDIMNSDEATVKRPVYLQPITLTFWLNGILFVCLIRNTRYERSKLMLKCLLTNKIWCDGASAHVSRNVRNYIPSTYGQYWIREGRPPSSKDLIS
ncbi:hypothetical protein TNCV_693671 [Trichonephila clavipes]|nr:hypothetical protein TNCV_693671 [Trichonephila clavipes]